MSLTWRPPRFNNHYGECQLNLILASFLVSFQTFLFVFFPQPTSFPPLEPRFHHSDTLQPLFVQSPARGKSGPTAHLGIFFLYTGLFPAVREIFPSAGRRNKRSGVHGARKGMREPICDLKKKKSLPARTGNEGDSFAITKFSRPFSHLRGSTFPGLT